MKGRWFKSVLNSHCTRWHLWLNGVCSPYFIDRDSYDKGYTVWGAGMSERGFAKAVNWSHTLAEAKAFVEATVPVPQSEAC